MTRSHARSPVRQPVQIAAMALLAVFAFVPGGRTGFAQPTATDRTEKSAESQKKSGVADARDGKNADQTQDNPPVAVEEESSARTKPKPPATKPAPPVDPQTQARIDGLIRQLGADEFTQREAATRDLFRLGSATIPTLQKVATSDDPEIAVRSCRILEELSRSDDDDAADAAEQALEQLSQGTESHARLAQVALANQTQIRHRRAISRLRKLGAELSIANALNDFVPANARLNIDAVDMILLGDEWTGGESGLAQIRRLAAIRILYVTPGAKIPQSALDDLAKDLPNVSIQTRSSAMLGVSGGDSSAGCQIQTVTPDGPADNGGVQIGDYVLLYNGKSMETFQQVIEETKSHRPGDVITLDILRNDEIISLDITLSKFSLKSLPRPR